jgi:hypothetical protein
LAAVRGSFDNEVGTATLEDGTQFTGTGTVAVGGGTVTIPDGATVTVSAPLDFSAQTISGAGLTLLPLRASVSADRRAQQERKATDPYRERGRLRVRHVPTLPPGTTGLDQPETLL